MPWLLLTWGHKSQDISSDGIDRVIPEYKDDLIVIMLICNDNDDAVNNFIVSSVWPSLHINMYEGI